MSGNFIITGQKTESVTETWKPVVKSKHAEIVNNYNELQLNLKENSDLMRQMDLFVRVYNDGGAFRCKLYRSENIGIRNITRELTGFNIPVDPKAWIVEYGGYSTSNETEFFEYKLSYLTEKSIAGMPLLMEYGNICWSTGNGMVNLILLRLI
jgi:alpha-glucosidase